MEYVGLLCITIAVGISKANELRHRSADYNFSLDYDNYRGRRI
jgi:hypothetical protein